MKYHQGKYTPRYPEKYVGDVTEITYRSGWEKKAMVFFDTNPSILRWGSEELIVPYMSPVDNKIHRYFPDFFVETVALNGVKTKYIVEVKPEAQCSPPKQTKNKKRLLTETSTYLVNQAKWAAATHFCKQHNMVFLVLTEKHLGIRK